MIVVKYVSETQALRKLNKDKLEIARRNLVRIIFGVCLTGRIPNSNLCKKCDSIPSSKAMVKERFKWCWLYFIDE